MSWDHFTNHQYNDAKNQVSIRRSTAGYHRDLKRKAKTPYTDKKISADPVLLGMPTNKTVLFDIFKVHLAYLFKHWNHIVGLYFGSTKWRRDKRRRRIRRQQVMDELCQPLLDRHHKNPTKPIVVFGNAGFSSTSKGNAGGPVKALRKLLKGKFRHRVEFVEFDEHRTSQRCSCCFKQLLSPSKFNQTVAKEDSKMEEQEENKKGRRCYDACPKEGTGCRGRAEEEKRKTEKTMARRIRLGDKKPHRAEHRVRVCLHCTHETQAVRVWNRDVNAARNMLQLYVYEQCNANGDRRPEFAHARSIPPKHPGDPETDTLPTGRTSVSDLPARAGTDILVRRDKIEIDETALWSGGGFR